MKSCTQIVSLAAVLLMPAASFAETSTPDYFVANCFNCHGTDGRASGAMPSLAGLDKAYIVQQMAAFKNGNRPASVMHQLAKGYTDDEIARAAAYFSQQQRVVKK